jgi:NAD(P)-dependent dehydrogenase (short-subunit alcohol dehydrogenase family)
MSKLQGKVAIITGATKGIGHVGARIFAREKAKVIVSGRSEKLGGVLVKEIRENGGDATYFQADTTRVKDLEKLVNVTIKTYGKLDILWYNAGTFLPGHIDLVKEQDYDEIMSVNVKGALFAAQFAIREMRKGGGGCILFTSSMVGLRPSPYDPQYSLPYGISKASLNMLARYLTEPLAKDNIRVNCICPGPVRTESFDATQMKVAAMTGRNFEDVIKVSASRVPMKRVLSMNEVAEVALFLCSDAASGITGAALPVDGGFSAV